MTDRPPTALEAMLAADEANGIDIHAIEQPPPDLGELIEPEPQWRPEPPPWSWHYRENQP